MFYNILGTFAQFFREQLSENVRMGNDRAVREGKWINRPKTGYDMIDGALVPNDQATTIREIFRLRAEGKSYREIEDRTGITYSTVRSILLSRIYVGEVLHNDAGRRGSTNRSISEAEWQAANRGHVPGRRRSQGRPVRQGSMRRLRPAYGARSERRGRVFYRCKHRGEGCESACPDRFRPCSSGGPGPPAREFRWRPPGGDSPEAFRGQPGNVRQDVPAVPEGSG